MKNIKIMDMRIEDYTKIKELWDKTEGIGLSNSDSEESIERYINRNSGLSLVAKSGEDVVGAVLCGHDGRRGYIHHLAIDIKYRKKGLGKKMIEECMIRLKREEIQKCHLFVFQENHNGISFWKRTGWMERNELNIMSKSID